MALYQYRCAQDGPHEVSRPIGTAPQSHPCPVCSVPSVRVFSAPMLGLGRRDLLRAIDRAEKTRDEPEVVTSLPSGTGNRRSRVAPPDPALQRLPRP